jgi:hypothetical protein
MKLYRNISLLVIALAAMLTAPASDAFSSDHYASHSKLASGKWVKITIPDNGVYELTYDELAAMGFSNPENVRVFGNGGYMLSEILNGSAIDDLSQIPVLRSNNKICFYGKGPKDVEISNVTSSDPHFIPTVNAYSKAGYYFLTDDSRYSDLLVTTVSKSNSGAYIKDKSYDYYYHEIDLRSPSATGKKFLGEDITSTGKIEFNYKLPNLTKGTNLGVNVAVGAASSTESALSTIINGDTVRYSSSSNIINEVSDGYNYYNTCSPYISMTPSSYSDSINMKIKLANTGFLIMAKLDYFMITYQHNNIFDKVTPQMRMDMLYLTQYDKIMLKSDNPNTVIWNIDNTQKPVQYTYEATDTTLSFTPGFKSNWSEFIVFNPSLQLNKISKFEQIENQDLHGLSTPDMVIIAPKAFMEQAQRIADMHKKNDNMDVVVVDHTKIFNEFSSGAPDATSYRLFAKMLYDRDPAKFKYLLLFGGGSYDNRKLIGNKDDNLLLTFQSTSSNYEMESYTTDDYFGHLDDNSGASIPADSLRIGIGRMPVVSLIEAENAVDKLINYVNAPSYGAWRNNALLVADLGDSGLHMFQAEGISNILTDNCNTNLTINKVFAANYPTTSNGICEAGKQKLSEMLTSGQLFMTFVGHAGPTYLTHDVKMWGKEDVKNTNYANLPVVSIAACDVARFDDDTRGIAEDMFHAPNGGAIALLASARTVYANFNDELNQSFVTNIFTLNAEGKHRTLGESLKNAKNAMESSGNINKLNFLLLGDPAMSLNYPKSTLKFTSIKGYDPAKTKYISILPLTKFEVKGTVNIDSTTVDKSFNGDVTVTLYDAKRLYTNFTQGSGAAAVTRASYFPREVLNVVSGRVVNGEFTLTVTVPRYCIAQNELGQLRGYAHRDSSSNTVNGTNTQLYLMPVDSSYIFKDTTAPVIDNMYLNNTTFSDGDAVTPDNTLHIVMSNDTGINTQSYGIGNSMSLVLDNGEESYPKIKSFFTSVNNGKGGYISFPISGLSYGLHSLKFTVSDISCNTASRSISFFVQPEAANSTLKVAESPVKEKATFSYTHEFSEANPEVTIHVLDATGNTVWSKATSTFPYEWNLTDNDGNRVKSGIYRFYGTVTAGNQYGGTNMGKIIVIDK